MITLSLLHGQWLRSPGECCRDLAKRSFIINSTSIATCSRATSFELDPLWSQIWELTSRTISSPGTTRAACNLGGALLRSQVISYPNAAETIDSLISSVELNGPSGITDSALSFWTIVAELRSKANPAQSQDMAKQICGWLKGAWTIGKTQTLRILS